MTNYLDQDGLSTLVNNIYQKFIENRGEVGGGSTPIYFDGKELVACSNIAAISAQSIRASGYIKYTNGLIIQWGFGETGDSGIELPLSFTDRTSYQLTICRSGSSPSGYALYRVSASYFQAYDNVGEGDGVFYIAIGY